MSGAYAQNIAEVFPIGPAQVIFNGNNLGHTDETGVKVTMKAKITQTKVAKYGDTPTGGFLNGQTVEIDCVIMQNDMTILAATFAGATIVTSGANLSKITFGVAAGTPIPSSTLQILPELIALDSQTPNMTFTCQAYPEGDFSPVYEAGKWVGYKAKFIATINEANGASGSWLAQFGLTSITSGGSAPTVSGVVPANAATGVAVGATIVWTFTEALQSGPQNINTENFSVVEDPLGTPVLVAGTVALVNGGASTTVTFTPTSNLASGKGHTAIVNPAVLAQNGIAYGGTGFQSHFAT